MGTKPSVAQSSPRLATAVSRSVALGIVSRPFRVTRSGTLLLDPPEDCSRVEEYPSVGKPERGQLGLTSCLAQLLPGSLAQKRDRAPVSRHHLFVRDPSRPEALLHPTAGVHARPPVIALAYI